MTRLVRERSSWATRQKITYLVIPIRLSYDIMQRKRKRKIVVRTYCFDHQEFHSAAFTYLVTTSITNTPAMSAIMDENDITRLAVLNNPIKCIQDIFPRRLVMASIVH